MNGQEAMFAWSTYLVYHFPYSDLFGDDDIIMFYSSFGDDDIITSNTVYCCNLLLHICDSFMGDYSVSFCELLGTFSP